MVIWRLIDGKPGHDNQSLGLVRALAALEAVTVREHAASSLIRAAADWRKLSKNPPPALIIGAGHATHLPMLAMRKRFGGRAVVLMRPSLPLGCFDLCLIPEHDGPPPRANVIATMGVLNPITAAPQTGRTHGLILIGGPSRHYRWDRDALLQQVDAIVQRTPQARWIIADSRRTPASTREALAAQVPARWEFVSCMRCPAGWLTQTLGRADTVWVTEDSASMVYEALSAGARVGLLGVPARRSSRMSRAVECLIAGRWVTPYARWQAGAALSRPPRRLNEASRCAALIRQRWFAGAQRP